MDEGTVEVYVVEAPKKMTQRWCTGYSKEKPRCSRKDSSGSDLNSE